MLIILEVPIGSTAILFASPFMVDVLTSAALGDFWDNVGDAVDITGGTIDAVELNDSTLTGCTVLGYAPLNGDGDLVGTFIPRKGTKSAIDAVVLEEGEFAYTTDTKEVRVGDGATSGGEGFGQAAYYHYKAAGTTLNVPKNLAQYAVVAIEANSGSSQSFSDIDGMRPGQVITFVAYKNASHQITFPNFTNGGHYWGGIEGGGGDVQPVLGGAAAVFATILRFPHEGPNGGTDADGDGDYMLIGYNHVDSA